MYTSHCSVTRKLCGPPTVVVILHFCALGGLYFILRFHVSLCRHPRDRLRMFWIKGWGVHFNHLRFEKGGLKGIWSIPEIRIWFLVLPWQVNVTALTLYWTGMLRTARRYQSLNTIKCHILYLIRITVPLLLNIMATVVKHIFYIYRHFDSFPLTTFLF